MLFLLLLCFIFTMPRKQGHGMSAKRSKRAHRETMSAQRQSQSGQGENVDEQMPASSSAPASVPAASAAIAAPRVLFGAADEDVRAGPDDLRHALFSGECGLPILTCIAGKGNSNLWTCERYDPAANAWSPIAELPDPCIHDLALACLSGSLYAVGGEVGAHRDPSEYPPWRYDAAADMWVVVPLATGSPIRTICWPASYSALPLPHCGFDTNYMYTAKETQGRGILHYHSLS